MSGERLLYLVNGSIPSWRVQLALHEKGLAYTPRRLRVMREPRETRSAELLALNPRGQTPVLVEPDGVVINESLAILTYLELRYPDPPLLPPRDDARALARTLAFTQEAETTACVYDPLEVFFHEKPEGLSREQRASVVEALVGLERDLALWEARAAGGGLIATEAFSLADCAFYPVLSYMKRRGLSLAGYPSLDGYERRVRARASAVAAYPEGWVQDRVGKPDLFAMARAAVGSE